MAAIHQQKWNIRTNKQNKINRTTNHATGHATQGKGNVEPRSRLFFGCEMTASKKVRIDRLRPEHSLFTSLKKERQKGTRTRNINGIQYPHDDHDTARSLSVDTNRTNSHVRTGTGNISTDFLFPTAQVFSSFFLHVCSFLVTVIATERTLFDLARRSHKPKKKWPLHDLQQCR